jgi:hypothetical protein
MSLIKFKLLSILSLFILLISCTEISVKTFDKPNNNNIDSECAWKTGTEFVSAPYDNSCFVSLLDKNVRGTAVISSDLIYAATDGGLFVTPNQRKLRHDLTSR